MITRVIIIGQGLFGDGLTRLLKDFPTVEIIGVVKTCTQARELIVQEAPDVLIVDHAQVSMDTSELNDILDSVDTLKVISLTLSENKMVIHNRQKLNDVTLSVLMQALQVQTPESASGESLE